MARRDPEDFERLARQLRQAANIDDRFCPDVIFVLNQLERVGVIAGYAVVPDDSIADDAFYDSARNLITMRESVWNALDHPHQSGKTEHRRARFTIAHELSHVALGHEGILHRGPTSERAKMVPSRVAEIEVGPFAAAFLVVSYFHVNFTAAKFRKPVLERMDRRRRRILREVPDKVREYLKERRPKGRNSDDANEK